jgi:hypothetical protein
MRGLIVDFQIWRCSLCGRLRHWGFGPNRGPDTAYLNCASIVCQMTRPKAYEPTLHTYKYVLFGSREDYPGVDWGDYKPRGPRLGINAGIEW